MIRCAPWTLAVVSFLLLGALAEPARSDAFTVNSTATDDDGSCDAAPADCTLPEAIDAASANAGRDTIDFDRGVFPEASPAVISPTAALPPITDPAGTIVDGSGAGVILEGSALSAGEHGLVIQSGAGAPLQGVVVQGLRIEGFPGEGLFVCGGAAPDCDEDVSKTRVVSVLAFTNGASGIRIDGRANTGTTVQYADVRLNDGRGVNLNASLGQALSKARVLGATALNNGSQGIDLNASGDNLGSQVVDAQAQGNDGTGINVNAGGDTTGARISRSSSSSNGGAGVSVNAGGRNTGTKISEVFTSDNGGDGFSLEAGSGIPVTGASVRGSGAIVNDLHGFDLDGSDNKISGCTADGNGLHGINLDAEGQSGGNAISKSQANGNGDQGIRVAFPNTANKISGNTVQGNPGGDLEDENPDCDDNVWSKNVFGTANQPCIE